jgi:hypothetical protein
MDKNKNNVPGKDPNSTFAVNYFTLLIELKAKIFTMQHFYFYYLLKSGRRV